MKKRIGITFSIYNRIDLSIKCLESIFNNGSKNDIFVVVVDNASSDNSCNIIKEKYPKVNIIKNNENLGCSRSWNQGIKKCVDSSCEYISLTQSDIIISKGVIDNSVLFLEKNKDIKLVSPACINVPFESGFDLSLKHLNNIAKKSIKKYGGSVNLYFIIYFFMANKDILCKYKFDENFKRATYEDADFYDSLTYDDIVSCHSIDIGMMFHRYNATQSIAKNSDPYNNKIYFDLKWKDKKKDLIRHQNKINNEFCKRILYPVEENNPSFFDLEKSGLFSWKRKKIS